MPVIRLQVELPMDTAVPQDAVVNTLYYSRPLANFDTAALTVVVDTVAGAYAGIVSHLASTINPTAVQFTAYDLNDPEPRVPIHQETRNIGVTATTVMPHEVALCLSYSALPVSGIPPARLRGRIYLGPFSAAASNNTTGRPTAAVLSAVAGMGDVLGDDPDLDVVGVQWVVYSPTRRGAGSAENGIALVRQGYVDDAWDSQRRRGISPGTRTLFSIDAPV